MTIPKKASLSLLVGPLSLFLCVVTAVGQQRIVALDMPAYPQVARNALIQGIVTIGIEVNKDGLVSSANLVVGHALLGVAAVQNVRSWKFLPGAPFETEVVFDFKIRDWREKASSERLIFDSYRRVEVDTDPPPPISVINN